MILNPTSGGSASVAAAVRAVEVKNGEAVNAGQFVQIQREGITIPVYNSVLTFPAERTAICALSETKLVAFYATTENGMYNLYATVVEKENGAWTEGVPVLVNCEETGQGYAAYTPVTAVKVSSDIVIVDTSQRESGVYNYWHELVAVKVDDDNVITAGASVPTKTSTSFWWVSSNAILEYAGEYNALFHCGFTENAQVAESDRSGRKIIGVTVDPTTLELKVGSAYNYLSDWINSNSAICRYANAVHLSDNRLLFAAAYQEPASSSSSAKRRLMNSLYATSSSSSSSTDSYSRSPFSSATARRMIIPKSGSSSSISAGRNAPYSTPLSSMESRTSSSNS